MRSTTFAQSVFTAVMLALLLVSCNDKSQNPLSSKSQTAYDRVLQTKTIRVAYISYPPSFIKDAKTGANSGIFHEVLKEMADRMELKVEYVEETAWGTMIESVRSGRVDLVCTGIWPNATRGKLVDFTDPVYFSPIKAYVRAGDARFDGNPASINTPKVRIATIDGEMSSIIAKTDFATAQTHALPQTTEIAQLLLEVSTGKADVTFVEPAVAEAFAASNPNMIQQVKNIDAVRVFPNVMMVAKGETNLLSMLNIAMSELANTGVVDKIVTKYEIRPGVFLRRQRPYQTSAAQ